MTRHQIITAAYLAVICAQFAVIIGFMLHSDRQERAIELWRIEATDWEQIAASYRTSAARYAYQSEQCLQDVRNYQRSMFQPVEMGK